jgi:hypothetical protein
MKLFFKTLFGLIFLLFTIVIICLFFFIHLISDLAVKHFCDGCATFEDVRLQPNGITLKNVTYTRARVPLKIGTLAITRGGDVLVKDLTAGAGNEVQGVNAVVHMTTLTPPAFEHQEIGVGLVNAGLPLTDGRIEASLSPEGALTIHKSLWKLAGGTVQSAPFSLPPGDLAADIMLTAKGLELPELFKIAPMEGLDATGKVDGTLPVKLRGGDVSIVNGVLQTTGKGAIRYNPREVPAFLQSAQNQVIDLRAALTAFDYESLTLTLNGEAGKSQKISLQAKGSNPGFYGGHAVVINFNVEGPLQSVIEYAPGGARIPDDIRAQIETYEKQHGIR